MAKLGPFKNPCMESQDCLSLYSDVSRDKAVRLMQTVAVEVTQRTDRSLPGV